MSGGDAGDFWDGFKTPFEKTYDGLREVDHAIGTPVGHTTETIGKIADGDLFYPDNPDRKRRCDQLKSDIEATNQALSSAGSELGASLGGVTKQLDQIRKLLVDSGIVDLDDARFNKPPSVVTINGVAYEVADFLVPLVAIEAISAAGVALSFTEAAVVAVVALGIVGAIEGADARDKMEDYIETQFPVRTKAYQKLLRCRALETGLGDLATGLDTATDVVSDSIARLHAKYPDAVPAPEKEYLRQHCLNSVNGKVNKVKTEIQDYDLTALQLSITHWQQQDSTRGSYTDDDPGYPSTELKIGGQYAGGIIFSLNADGLSGLVITEAELGSSQGWAAAQSTCEVCNLHGYSDWRLATAEEWDLISTNLFKANLGGFSEDYYWCSTPGYGPGYHRAWDFIPDSQYAFQAPIWTDGMQNLVRAVRDF